jgi:hypothetical protein
MSNSCFGVAHRHGVVVILLVQDLQPGRAEGGEPAGFGSTRCLRTSAAPRPPLAWMSMWSRF